MLEQKLGAMNDSYTNKQAQLDEILQAANLDPAEVARVISRLDEVLQSKNSVIRDMKYKVARASKAYNDTLGTFEAKFEQVGIPADEFASMGFRKVLSATSVGPAGLVAQ